jgi:hypothetical protein
MSAAAGDRRVPDHALAAKAFLSIASINAMTQLEFPFATVGALIVGNR